MRASIQTLRCAHQRRARIGYPLLLLKMLSDFFNVNLGGGLLFIPGALFELLVSLGLIVKGFNLTEKVEQPAWDLDVGQGFA